MPIQVKKHHPALKHAGYAATGILPGESSAEFEKLHRDLIAELGPNGALENDIVATVARLVWRKKNLETFRIAELARSRSAQIMRETVPEDKIDYPDYSSPLFEPVVTKVDPAVRAAAIRAAVDQARKELGDAYGLVEIGDIATVDQLMKGLEVQDRLDAMIDRCLKRLLFLRGLKSISSASTSAPRERLAGPSKAA
jgi:hypothetical protein